MNNAISIFQQMLSMGNNPKQIEMMILNQNPQMLAISNMIKQSKLPPIPFAVQYAKQNNIPIQINPIIQQMMGMIPR